MAPINASSEVRSSITSMHGSSSSGVVSSHDVEVGELFPSKKGLKSRLAMVAMSKNFEIRVKKSTKDLYTVGCYEKACTWRLRAVKLEGTEFFRINKYVSSHTCSIELLNHDHRQASAEVIGHIIQSKFAGVGRVYKPKHIIEDVRQEYGVNISYDKAWRAREMAHAFAKGTPEDSYTMLHAYGEALKIVNPGTVFDVELEDSIYFKYVFMALGPCIRGYARMRDVVIVDGSHLKGKYKGCMLVAVGRDGNNQLYPLAYAIVDSENDSSWTWFMTRLKMAIGGSSETVIVSDRHQSIAHSVQVVFPTSFHGVCTYHLETNVANNYKDKAATQLFKKAARAVRESEFKRYWEQLLLLRGGIVARYLEGVGIDRWAACFQKNRRYDNMTSNSAECFNSLTAEARLLPIVPLLDYIREHLQGWFYERRNYWFTRTMIMSDYAEKRMASDCEKGRRYRVDPIDCYTYHVRDGQLDGIVNLQTRQCTCREFDLYEIPCSHAIVAARVRNISPSSLCNKCYTVEALQAVYAEPIYPVGHRSEWPKPSGYVDMKILPPRFVVRVGRRRVQRIPSAGEHRTTKKCGRCGNVGHNRQSCNQPLSTLGQPNDK